MAFDTNMNNETKSAMTQMDEAKAVLNALNRISREFLPVRMELEHHGYRFNTQLSLKSQLVIVSKSAGLKGLAKGEKVRFSLPWDLEKLIQMEILKPHFNLPDNRYGFICGVPNAFGENSGRLMERFNTTRFNNLHLSMLNRPTPLRVVDLSRSGCKVLLPDTDTRRGFKLGERIPGAWLNLGNRLSLELSGVVPRSHNGKTLGCQLEVDESSPTRRVLDSLLSSLGKVESYAPASMQA